MAIYDLDGQAPELPADGDFFIADTAAVIGKVRLKARVTVWLRRELYDERDAFLYTPPIDPDTFRTFPLTPADC